MAKRKLGELYWAITGDDSDISKKITSTKKGVTGLGSAIQVAFKAASLAGVTALTKSLISAASAAEETKNKFDVTFSSITEKANLAAVNLQESFGLSSTASQQLLSDTGDLLTGFGFTQESALDLSDQVNQLAIDLASFTNYSGGAEGASAALTKGLLGERESMKSLGIAITEADITQLAEDKGITGELDRQTTAMLTLELAMTQSKNAIGDFERSEESFANQSRIAEGNIQDLAAGFGDILLPLATQAVSLFNDITDAINDLGNNSKELILELGGIGAAFAIGGPIAGGVAVLLSVIAEIRDATDRTDELDEATTTLISTSDNYNTIVKQLADNNDTLTASEKALLENRKELLAIELQSQMKDLSDEYENMVGQAADAVSEQDLWLGRVEDSTQAIEDLKNGVGEYAGYNLGARERAALISQETAELEINRNKYIEAGQDATSANLAISSAVEALSGAVLDGSLDISTYAFTNKELYDVLTEGVETVRLARIEQEALTASTNAATEAAERASEAEALRSSELDAYLTLLDKEYEATKSNREILEEEIALWEGYAETAVYTADKVNTILEYKNNLLQDIIDTEIEEASQAKQTAAEEIQARLDEKGALENNYDALDTTTEKIEAMYSAGLIGKNEYLESLEELGTSFETLSEQISTYGDIAVSVWDTINSAIDASNDAELEAIQDKIDAYDELYENKADLESEYADMASALYDSDTDSYIESLNEQIAALADGTTEKAELEETLAAVTAAIDSGSTDDYLEELADQIVAAQEAELAQEALEEEYAEKEEELAAEASARNKAIAIGTSIVNTLVAVTKLLATPALAVTAGISGAAATAEIIATDVDSFESGNVIPGDPSDNDTTKIAVNPQEEILSEDDPRHSYNSAGNTNFTIMLDSDIIAKKTVKIINGGNYTINARGLT